MVHVRVSAFIKQGEPAKVLLIQHRRLDRIYVTLPGGRGNEGETVEHALRRGVREESGLEVVLNDLLFVADALDPATTKPRLDLVFSGTVVGGELRSALQGSPSSGQDDGAYFVPLRSLEREDLYPPIAAHLLGACGGEFCEGGRYLVVGWEDVGNEADALSANDRARDEKET